MAESKEELKSLLMMVKEESERAGLKLHIKKTKITASAPITAWQIEGGKVEVVTDFLFLGSETTMGGDCSCEIRRWLLLDLKAMINLDSVLKSRGITLPTKAVVFPAGTCGCENRTMKKAEHWRIELWTVVLEKTPESPLDSKEIKPVSLKGSEWVSESCSVMSDSLWPHGLCSPWNSSGQNTGVGSLFLL